MVKGGDDLRQEVIVMQIIKIFQKSFELNNVPIKLFPYDVIVTS